VSDRIQSFWHSYVKGTVQKAIQKTPAVATGDAQVPPPLPVLSSLLTKINQLPPPLPCQQTVQNELIQAIRVWQADPEIANNSLVVLGRPVEDVAKIIKTSLQSWPTEDSFPIDIWFQLGGYQRPTNPLDINEHVRKTFPLKKATADRADDTSAKTDEQTDEQIAQANVPTLVVVPRLEQLFLRCIQGWEGVEYLQNLTTRDPSRFWVFGCNHWAWAFLDRVCQISAYLEQPLRLPELTGEDLQHWLTPLFSEPIALCEHERPIQLAMASDSAWQSLSSASSGIGATAARLWLASLRIADTSAVSSEREQPSDTTTLETLKSSSEPTQSDLGSELSPSESVTTLSTGKAVLPSLMTLDGMDRYLLYALLIHGEMTRAHLALSLGEAERKIRSRLQVLRREGILIQRGRRLSVNPAYYPKLFTELKNNNFLIGEV